LHEEFGKDAQIASIGPAGEKLSLSASIMNEKFRAAARSALGAVMGSKRLKAVVAKGNKDVPIADKKRIDEVRKKLIRQIRVEKVGFSEFYTKYGTPGVIGSCAMNGDAPVKNWGGIGVTDFPRSDRIDYEFIKGNVLVRRYGCWQCPIACSGIVEVKNGPYKTIGHQAEYETATAFGTLCLNDNPESIIKANDICNKYGVDTIAVGGFVAFAIECYENGVINRKDTGGLELTWGNHEAIVSLTEQIAKGEGFGKTFAGGIEGAVKRIGAEAEKYAMHIQGEVLPLHDPRFEPALGAIYKLDATPSRHTQGACFFFPSGLEKIVEKPGADASSGRGKALYTMTCLMHVVNCAGICLFSFLSTDYNALSEQLAAVVGLDYEINELLTIGERIHTIRHMFNLREGINPTMRKVPERMLRPMSNGPNKGRRVDMDTMTRELFNELNWDVETAMPSSKRLETLGLRDLDLSQGVTA
jgi:aldehyde:ferredoxin oxidoreductase